MSILTLKGVSKRFSGVTVVDNVTVDVNPGEVHVLLGENGAGKSTLIKMMAGIYTPDDGEIIVDGQPTKLPTPKAAEALGIATIHQELNLVGTLSVAENIMLGRLPTKGGLVDRVGMRTYAASALERIGLKVNVNRRVGTLGIAQQQLIEIARALSLDSRLLILDEPTAALTQHEAAQLFEVMEDLRSKGVAMVFISHHLDEIARIGDVVTVLRDGQFVKKVPASTPEPELVKLMVGRDIDDQFPRVRTAPGKPMLEVRGLTRAGAFTDIDFTVHAGEIVGIAGLVGAGRTEVVRAIAGADRYDSGEVRIDGTPLSQGSVVAALKAGVGHVPEDRKVQGLVIQANVSDNMGLATLFSSGRGILADLGGQRQRAGVVAEQLRIRMTSLDQVVKTLSGGNQQKIVFGRWLMAKSTVLLLDEPTRGVDVGAKVEIYQLMNQITQLGGAVLMVSSELPEVLGMADRVVVMSGGRITGELSHAEATQDAVMTLAVSNSSEGAA